MERKYLFRVPDMWEKASTPKVVRCIEEIQKLVKKLFCPNMGEIYFVFLK